MRRGKISQNSQDSKTTELRTAVPVWMMPLLRSLDLFAGWFYKDVAPDGTSESRRGGCHVNLKFLNRSVAAGTQSFQHLA